MADSEVFKTRARLLKASKLAATVLDRAHGDFTRAIGDASAVVEGFTRYRTFRSSIEASAIPNSEPASEATWNVALALLRVASAGSPTIVVPRAIKPMDRIVTDQGAKGVYMGVNGSNQVVWQEDGVNRLHTSMTFGASKPDSVFVHEDGTPILWSSTSLRLV